jgi:hypothetical protein
MREELYAPHLASGLLAVGLLCAQAVVLQAHDIAHPLKGSFSLAAATSDAITGFMDSAFIVAPSRIVLKSRDRRETPENPPFSLLSHCRACNHTRHLERLQGREKGGWRIYFLPAATYLEYEEEKI